MEAKSISETSVDQTTWRAYKLKKVFLKVFAAESSSHRYLFLNLAVRILTTRLQVLYTNILHINAPSLKHGTAIL
jgi:hypothetical protein